MIGGMSIYQIFWFFIVYSVLGWCVEVAYHALTLGKVINRGFLNGPVCPIYGFGMLAILMVFNTISGTPYGNHALALFFGGMALTTSIELFGGWALDRLFHLRWWDYSNEPFNFHGYICLRFSVFWGLGTVFMYRIVHPTVAALTVSLLPVFIGSIVLVILYTGFGVDLCVSVATVRGLNRDLAELDELKKKLRVVSDSMSEYIGQNTIRTAKAGIQLKENAEHLRTEVEDRALLKAGEVEGYMGAVLSGQAARAEELQQERIRQHEADNAEIDRQFKELERKREELRARYEAVRAGLYKHPWFGAARLVRAFPGAVHREHNELLKEFRKRLDNREKAMKKTGSEKQSENR